MKYEFAKIPQNLSDINKNIIFKKLRVIYRETDKYSGMCPEGCSLCERFEDLILIPFEDDFIAKRLSKSCIKREKSLRRYGSIRLEPAGIDCSMLDDNHKCLIYQQRPLDCRAFPVIPRFKLKERNGVDFFLSNWYCPIAHRLPNGFINAMKDAWKLLSPDLPNWWKNFYNLRSKYNGMTRI